ncbi:MAG: hypothetical protein QW279_10600 [Candidatus Jordarchaeaceae archaeon]
MNEGTPSIPNPPSPPDIINQIRENISWKDRALPSKSREGRENIRHTIPRKIKNGPTVAILGGILLVQVSSCLC